MAVCTATEKQDTASLPAFVDSLSGALRLTFARVSVLNRSAKHPGKDTLTIRVERPDAYLDELVEVAGCFGRAGDANREDSDSVGSSGTGFASCAATVVYLLS